MARLDQAELARVSGVSLETVKRLEGVRGAINANMRTIEALYVAFLGAGVDIHPNPDGRICVCQAATPFTAISPLDAEGPF